MVDSRNGKAATHPAIKKAGPFARWNGRVSIAITLATAIGLLVLVAVGGVLGVGVWLAHKNTFALLSANAHQSVSAAVDRIRHHLDPADDVAEFLAERIAQGEADPADHDRFGRMLVGALGGTPQIDAVMFIDPERHAFLAARDRQSGGVMLRERDYSADPVIRDNMAASRKGPRWGLPVWRDDRRETYLNRAYPVLRDGRFIGAVVAVVSVRALSDFVGEAEFKSPGREFILYGRDRVLAHPLLISGYPGRSVKEPLPALATFGDPLLAAIWRQEGRKALALDLPTGIAGHALDIHNDEYVFLYQQVEDYGPRPLIVGIYFRGAEIGQEIRRIAVSLLVGLAALSVALVCAIVLGRHIARPIIRFSAAAGRIRDLDIAKVEPLPHSLFRELDGQARAFNAMLGALRWFELYVPRTIVARLVRQGSAGAAVSEARRVTVLFTDIADFTAAWEGRPAAEVADFLNAHFALIGDIIEAEGGTVDKFIGDSVMAFWGAPEAQPDSAARACRAALAIAEAIRADNARRTESGAAPVRVRIGIHTGSATVGNIGSPNRLNYTIVGDAVNIGQRLEQMGKELYPAGTEIAILISGETAAELGADFVTVAAGRFQLKGHAGETAIFRLEASTA